MDYAGQKVPIIDYTSGEIKEAEIFVAVMGASNYTFAEATWSQRLPDWIGSHVRTFSNLGGVPELVVPDNLHAGVSKVHRYESDINQRIRTWPRTMALRTYQLEYIVPEIKLR